MSGKTNFNSTKKKKVSFIKTVAMFRYKLKGQVLCPVFENYFY